MRIPGSAWKISWWVRTERSTYAIPTTTTYVESNPSTSAAAEIVYAKGDSAGPSGPEGPSFNTLGDLYFNTRGSPATHTGVWKITTAQLKGTLPVSPTQGPPAPHPARTSR